MSYPGKSACGQIYRMVTAIEPQDRFTTQLPTAEPHALLRRDGLSPEILELARRLKRRHDVMLSYVCSRYKVTDIEVLAGVALRNGKRKRVKDQDLKVSRMEQAGDSRLLNLLLGIAALRLRRDHRHDLDRG